MRFPQRKRQKDVLNLSLKNLRVGDEIIFTFRTYDAVKDRIEYFRSLYPEQRHRVWGYGNVQRIKRLL
jgi:hypothetical protein